MLRREVEIMGSMRHPNCVSFYGACFEPGFTGPPPPPSRALFSCRVLGANAWPQPSSRSWWRGGTCTSC
jgi:hypothetical protein